jgi:hypothetical protein
LQTTGANIKSFSDATAANNNSTISYRYYVCAYNASGNSPMTNAAIVCFQPINLKVIQPATPGAITLSWTDKNSDETGFEIYRKEGGCASANAWTRVATVGANVKTWTNTGLVSGNTFSYQVRAINKSVPLPNAYGYSSYSNCSSAAVP